MDGLRIGCKKGIIGEGEEEGEERITRRCILPV